MSHNFHSAVITFPGSNCDQDLEQALKLVSSKTSKIWHADTELPSNLDLIAVPGGFSYGDYLRSGAIAANSKIMTEVKKFAEKGGYVIGICNGFQILTETQILPGTLLRNKNLKFLSKLTKLKIENNSSKFTNQYQNQQIIDIPIAHHDGNYFCSDDELKSLQDNQQIAFTYQDNPNGSIANIAGIFNKRKNVLGMMPHPERAINKILANGDQGLDLFKSLIS
jgi:phosphoribosylformylglycinamidine synthase subunit PurQ / glutaminase